MGSATCAGCHTEQADAWRGSHHDLAMQQVDGGVGPEDLAAAAFPRPPAYRFGVTPLQQFLIPVESGGLQVHPRSWDARPASEGGQRWFDVYDGAGADPQGPLHWMQPSQNWDHQCADCHSTGLEKSYDVEAARFATTYAEEDVACEACHGPGSEHVALASSGGLPGSPTAGFPVALARAGLWQRVPDAPTGVLVGEREQRPELDVCGRCHARRSQLTARYPVGEPLADHYRLALLEERLYHPDGQVLDETFVLGSFLQSRMHQAGVSCSDCHDPHDLSLRSNDAGPDAVCAQCHDPGVFAASTHTMHSAGDVACVDCHMPETTFMQVDARRDHSFRIPRPDLAEALAVPDACSSCHAPRIADDPGWAARALRDHLGRDARGLQGWGPLFAAARSGDPAAQMGLRELVIDRSVPDIARASAIGLLRGDHTDIRSLLRELAEDPSDLVRRAVAETVPVVAADHRMALLAPLFTDPRLSVRVAAGRAVADRSPTTLTPAARGAVAEYEATLLRDQDRPEALVNLANLRAATGGPEAATPLLSRALRLEPGHEGAAVNLADALRVRGFEDRARRVLIEALEVRPDSAGVHHALGLAWIRIGDVDAALAALRRATELAPAAARYAFVYAIALHDAGDAEGGRAELARILQLAPWDADALDAATAFALAAGDREAAATYAPRLLAVRPDHPAADQLRALGAG